MNNLILVDGNNLLFRSYYATAYNGNFMKNSKGFPTNALFGFTNMINKIIDEEKPTHIIVAFDKGKTFRHDKYDWYKAGRIAMPDELKVQFPVAKELLTNMGITYYEIDNYEADDIIGTFASFCEENPNYTGTIISSDKDLLQLISDTVNIKLLKSKDYVRYDVSSFKSEWGIDPINIIDLKALMGDSSDNIPGVKGIGEKTALKLLQDYKTLDGIYSNIDSIKGKVHDKLVDDKDSAYMSYEIATIYREVPLDINIDDLVYRSPNLDKLNSMYEDLEFYSFLKKNKVVNDSNIDFKIVKSIDEINIDKPCSIYLEVLGNNYHSASILGMGVYNESNSLFIPYDILMKEPSFFNDIDKYTYDLKKVYVSLKQVGIGISNVSYDGMLAAYLLEYNLKDDISYLANSLGYSIPFYETFFGKKCDLEYDYNDMCKNAVMKAKFIYDTYSDFSSKLESEGMTSLFKDIEMPLSLVLGDMEYDGINISRSTLEDMGVEISSRIDVLSSEIYGLAGCEFNISSTQQLGDILFEKLGLPHGKKGKTGYSTAVDVLNKLRGKHPIIEKVLEYRTLTKLYSTYIEGLIKEIGVDGKIHTIYNQALTRTGRLSSSEPNLQNIPARDDYGKLIRKAFVPSSDSVIISGDYSQIELRILASIASVDTLIDAFNRGDDIHSKTASDIFHKDINDVTSHERRVAKAVNFGIIYGISGFGLSENLNITPKEAKMFIDEYLSTYPGIKEYMDKIISNALHDGYVRTLFNRKRVIPELQNKNYMIRQSGERMALNTPIQGTSADIIKKAMVMVSREIHDRGLKSKMVLQIHDELVFDTPSSEIDEMCLIIRDVMENVCSLAVPLSVDINIGDNLMEAK